MEVHPPPRFLAIAPGTKTLGVAVLEGPAFVYYAVKNLQPGPLPRRLRKQGIEVIKDLLAHYTPEVLVTEETHYRHSRRSPHLATFAAAMRELAKRQKIKVVSYPPQALKAAFAESPPITKGDLAAAVARRYPELRRYLPRPRKRWEGREGYWMSMFVACALALVHADKLGTGRKVTRRL